MPGKHERTPWGEITQRISKIGFVLPQFTEKGNTIADCLKSAVFLEEDPSIIRRYDVLHYIGKTRSGTEFTILFRKPWDTELKFSAAPQEFSEPFTFLWSGGNIPSESRIAKLFPEPELIGISPYTWSAGGISFSFHPDNRQGRLDARFSTSFCHWSNNSYFLDSHGEAKDVDKGKSSDGYAIGRFVYHRESGLVEVSFTGPEDKKADFVLPAAITVVHLPADS